MKKRDWVVPAAFAACCLPALWFVVQFLRGGLSANPVDDVLNGMGYWAFVLLALTLACTPLSLILKLKWPLRIRKLLGDFSFTYACLHLASYVGLDQGLDFSAIGQDILKHKFIMLGMATWLLLLPLAVTSTQGWQKRLGFRRWKRLHRVVYVAGVLASIHFFLRFKTARIETIAWGALVAALLLVRVVDALRKRAPVIQSS